MRMKNIAGLAIKRLRTGKNPWMTRVGLASVVQLEGMRLDRAGVAIMEGDMRRNSDVKVVLIAPVLGVAPRNVFKAATCE